MSDKNNHPIRNKNLPWPGLLIKSYFSTWALMRIGQIHSMNIMALLLFVVLFYFFGRNTSSLNPKFKSHQLLTHGFALLLSVLYLAGSYQNIIFDVSNGLFQAILVMATLAGLFFFIKEILLFLTSFFYGPKAEKEHLISYDNQGILSSFLTYLKKNRRKLPAVCFFLCIAARIPFFLYSYPGIMTPDSINQLEQVLGMKPYSNHHPWVHTMIISLFYHLGTLFTENKNLAFACYTIFQIIFMALASSYLIYILLKYVKSEGLLFFMILLYAFLPYHNVMAICIWKDVMFSGTVLFFSATLLDLIMIQKKRKKEGGFISVKETPTTLIIYFISAVLFSLLRTNGWYAFIITLPLLFLSFWKNKKILYTLHFMILFTILLIKGPVMDHYEVKQPDFVESLSIPLQQVGRVIAGGNSLLPQEKELLSKIMNTEHIPALYTEYISDPMKELVRAGNPEYLSAHKTEYLQLWISLGLRYPQTYLEAYLEQTKGFYSPATVYSVAEVDGIIDSDTGVTREYLLRGKIIVKLREILLKLHEILPVYGSLWSMGSLLWGILILLYLKMSSVIILKKEDSCVLSSIELITLWLPSLAIVGTLLLATPVAIEFRYAYHLAYCLPLYLGIINIKESI